MRRTQFQRISTKSGPADNSNGTRPPTQPAPPGTYPPRAPPARSRPTFRADCAGIPCPCANRAPAVSPFPSLLSSASHFLFNCSFQVFNWCPPRKKPPLTPPSTQRLDELHRSNQSLPAQRCLATLGLQRLPAGVHHFQITHQT